LGEVGDCSDGVVMMMPWLQVKKQRKAAGDRKVKEQGTD
jgi:hypothetical protein